MNRKLIFRPQAEAELANAVDWYETRGKGLVPISYEPSTLPWQQSSETPISIRSSRANFDAPCCVGSRTA
jgi:hypothetical protein